MPDPKHHDNCKIPDQLKTTIGRLIVVNAAEAEPAKKIHFTSALISQIRSALLIKIRYWNTDKVDDKMWDLFKAMAHTLERGVEYWARVKQVRDELMKLHSEQMNHPGDEPTEEQRYATYDLLNDFYIIQQCRDRWKNANEVYFMNPDSWRVSNEYLADIHDILIDMANKHDLIIIPKNTFFSIDELNNYGTFKVPEREQK